MTDERLSEQQQRALAEVAGAPEFPRERIRGRIRASIRARNRPSKTVTGPTLRWAATAAAALVIFVAGVEYGRRIASIEGTQAPASAPMATEASHQGPDSVAFAIQAQGTRYVAELARLSETADSLSEEELEQARGVAAAILYGVAVELLRAAPDDELAELIVRMMQGRRAGDDKPMVWF